MTTPKPSLPCIICENVLVECFEHDDTFIQPSNGLVCSTTGNYGSTVYDPVEMNPARLLFNICDDCFHAKAERGFVYETFIVTKTTQTKPQKWNPDEEKI